MSYLTTTICCVDIQYINLVGVLEHRLCLEQRVLLCIQDYNHCSLCISNDLSLSRHHSTFISLFQIRMDTENKQEWHNAMWIFTSLTGRKQKMLFLLALDLIAGLEMVSCASKWTFGGRLPMRDRSINFPQVRYFTFNFTAAVFKYRQIPLTFKQWHNPHVQLLLSLTIFVQLFSNNLLR